MKTRIELTSSSGGTELFHDCRDCEDAAMDHCWESRGCEKHSAWRVAGFITAFQSRIADLGAELTAMRERAEKAEEQLKVKGEYGYSQFVVDGLAKERNDLKADLAANAALLADQHDRNMELETELMKAINILDKLYKMLNDIPCNCTLEQKTHSLPASDCPRCNLVDKWELDIAAFEIDKIQQALNSKGE